jgi:hypothetical protein
VIEAKQAMVTSERVKARVDHGLIAVVLLVIVCGATRIAASVDGSSLAQGNLGSPQTPRGPVPQGAPSFATGPFRPLPANDGPAPTAHPAPDGTSGGVGGALGGAITGAILGALIGLTLWALKRSAKAPIRVDPATGGAVVEISTG